jgi:hypothetical protein
LNGLKPNTTYLVRFNFQIATNAPTGCLGVGGAPGDSVYVKAGATQIEPITDTRTQLINIDKGNQSMGGRDMFVLGTIARSEATTCSDAPFEFKQFDSQATAFEATTDSNGELWVIIGTDSAFESRTSLFYSNITVELVEK